MESKEKFGQFITQKRKEQQMTQKDFAAKLFVTESAVSKWERGISYPDISLVLAICRELHITEHELITASEDYQHRQIEKQAKGFRNIVKTYSAIFYGAYGISLLVCLIINLAIEHTLSWFFIVLTAELTAFSFLNLPVIFNEKKGLTTIVGSYISLNLLLLVCNNYNGGNWFGISFVCILTGYVVIFLPFVLRSVMKPIGIGNHKAILCFIADTILIYILVIVCCMQSGAISSKEVLDTAVPLITVGIILPWMHMIAIRYSRCNGYYKAAICLGTTGIYIFACNGIINTILYKKKFAMPAINLAVWNETYTNGNVHLIILLSTIVLSVAFAISGIMYSQKRYISEKHIATAYVKKY